MRLKNFSSPMPKLRATSISGLVSWEKVTIPSTSSGRNPASAMAAAQASTARRISLRPELLENSVAPIPAMAAWSLSRLASLMAPAAHRENQPHRARHVVAEAVGPAHRHLDDALLADHRGGGHRARHAHRVGWVVGRTETDGHLLDDGVRAGPIGDEAPDEA